MRRFLLDSALIVESDINSKSPAWGSEKGDARGGILERFATALELWLKNVASVPTFAVNGRSSVNDVTFDRLPKGSVIRW